MKLGTKAIVLRDYKIEEDRILTLLTEKYGVLTAYANGANRMRSALASSTELLCYSDMILFKNKDRYSVDKADGRRSFFGLRARLEDLALASYFAALTAELAPQGQGENADAYLRLLLNTLHHLEGETRPRNQLKALLELRMLTLAGYMPNLVGCRECGTYEAANFLFYPEHGDLLCPNCAPPGTVGIGVSPGVLAAMRHILYSEPKKLFAFSLSEEGLVSLEKISEYYMKYQLERTFPTLEYYHSLLHFRL